MTALLDVVAIKSFGDLVIALTSIAQARNIDLSVRLMLGAHLCPLLAALGDDIEHVVLDHGENGVPSAYDIRKNGIIRAARSMVALRRAISTSRQGHLLFPTIGPRERFLSAGAPALALPEADNIYRAYAAAFGNETAAWPKAPLPSTADNRPIGIFPGSRLVAKNIPLMLVEEIFSVIAATGEPRLFSLAGERPDIEASNLPVTVVETRFEAMIAAIESCKAIVSADSMPAHIAEKRSIPVFVATPVENSYWLPLTSFETGEWSLFSQGTGGRLPGFIARING